MLYKRKQRPKVEAVTTVTIHSIPCDTEWYYKLHRTTFTDIGHTYVCKVYTYLHMSILDEVNWFTSSFFHFSQYSTTRAGPANICIVYIHIVLEWKSLSTTTSSFSVMQWTSIQSYIHKHLHLHKHLHISEKICVLHRCPIRCPIILA